MKHFFGFFLAAGLSMAINGGAFANESPAGMKIIWAVPTNVWPINGIWTYKVIPQEFSDAVISNAMALGSFTMKDKVKLSAGELAIDKSALFFRNKDESKWLIIVPVWGYIEYNNENVDAKATSAVKGVPEPVVSVPDLPEATQLALKYARLLGIDVSLFARKSYTNDFDLHWIVETRGWNNPRTKKPIEEIDDFGISFDRRIDGFPVSGFGDFEVCFGNNAKVSRLTVSWRNLQPYELRGNLISPEQVVKSIEDGRTRLPRLPDELTDGIKTVTITNATPRYNRKPADGPMDFVIPGLQLDAIISSEKTNMPVWFQTVIFTND
ncbi:MAG: hypothetical protein ABSF34_06305 [Verrucomicrobiota bacterium]|jgi:hypothetical protein